MTHVLVVPVSYPREGAPYRGVFFRDQVHALRKRGLQVGVAYPDMRSLAVAGRRAVVADFRRIRIRDDAGARIYTSAFHAVPRAPRIRARQWLRTLDRLVGRYVQEEGPPDVIHAHGILWAGVGAVQAGAALERPVVITAHSTAFARRLLSRPDEEAVRGAVNAADAVLAVSSPLQSQLNALAPGVPVRVLPNMVDVEFFAPPTEVRRGPEFVFLSVGLLVPKKGMDVLLEAFAKTVGGEADVRLLIVGDGAERGNLERQARSLGLSDRVSFLGTLSREGVRSRMQQADAFVLPSRSETFGVVLIEAMSTGLPVVATRSGGPEDFVYPEVGLLVEPDNVDELTEALMSVCRHRARWHERALEIRSYVADRFGERAVTDQLLSVFGEVRDSQ